MTKQQMEVSILEIISALFLLLVIFSSCSKENKTKNVDSAFIKQAESWYSSQFINSKNYLFNPKNLTINWQNAEKHKSNLGQDVLVVSAVVKLPNGSQIENNKLCIVKTNNGFTAFMEQFVSDITGKLTNTKTGYQLLYKPDKGLVQISNICNGKPLSTVGYSKIQKNLYCAIHKNLTNSSFKSGTSSGLDICYYFQCPGGTFFNESTCNCDFSDNVTSFPSLEAWGYTDDCSKKSFTVNLSTNEIKPCICLCELINNGAEVSYFEDTSYIGVTKGSDFIMASLDLFPELISNSLSATLWYILGVGDEGGDGGEGGDYASVQALLDNTNLSCDNTLIGEDVISDPYPNTDRRTVVYHWTPFTSGNNGVVKIISDETSTQQYIGDEWQFKTFVHTGLGIVNNSIGVSVWYDLISATPHMGTYNSIMEIHIIYHQDALFTNCPIAHFSHEYTTAKAFNVND